MMSEKETISIKQLTAEQVEEFANGKECLVKVNHYLFCGHLFKKYNVDGFIFHFVEDTKKKKAMNFEFGLDQVYLDNIRVFVKSCQY